MKMMSRWLKFARSIRLSNCFTNNNKRHSKECLFVNKNHPYAKGVRILSKGFRQKPNIAVGWLFVKHHVTCAIKPTTKIIDWFRTH